MIRNTKDAVNNLSKSYLGKASKFVNEHTEQMSTTLQRLNDRRICLGITGLSQSGKSTFVTSLIDQLINYKTSALSGFSPVLEKRLIGVKLLPLTNKKIANFPYQVSIAGLKQPQPNWPSSTTDISGCVLELKLQKATTPLNPFSKENFSLFIELRDYPGEWLLDLPLRNMDYARWCWQCSAQFNREPRKQILGDLLLDLQNIDPMDPVDFKVLAQLKTRFVGFLEQCKAGEHPLSLIQPGRFLMPGHIEDETLLCFVPLLKAGSFTDGQLEAAAENSYFKVCEQRYKAYIKQLVEPFYKDFFSGIDRQVVLVDVVTALNSGPLYLDDMRQALSNISDSFSYGLQNRIMQLFTPKIDKVVFAATKADQVVSSDHASLVKLLESLVDHAYKTAQYEGVPPTTEAVAGVRSSIEVAHEGDAALSGFDATGAAIGYVHPPIPAFIAKNTADQGFKDWNIPKFNPPILPDNTQAVPHIRIDSVLNSLVGDKCS
jgi:predicted YcjX-like family ATPase